MSAAPRLAAVDALLAEWDRPDGPGCATAVLRDGRLVHQGCYGLASIEHGVAIRPDTAFRVASVTKHMTAAAALLLADQGRLDLDGDVRRRLPELDGELPPVTARHLMGNASGVRDSLELVRLAGGGLDMPHGFADQLALVARQRATSFAPGSSYLYSNGGFLLLTALIERAADRPLAEVLAERLFRPLGLGAMRLVGPPDAVVPNMAASYFRAAGGGWRRGINALELSGEGGMVATLDDLVAWVASWPADPLGVIARLARPERFPTGAVSPYALGLMVESHRGRRVVGHSGLLAGWRASVLWFPELALATICIANADPVDAVLFGRRMAEAAMPDAFDAVPPAPEAGLADALVAGGPYLDPAGPAIAEISRDGDRLLLATHSFGTAILSQSGDRLAVARGALEHAGLTVERGGNAVAALHLHNVDGTARRLVPLASLPRPAAPAATYAGRYRSAETGGDLVVEPGGEGLVGRIEGMGRASAPGTVRVLQDDLLALTGRFGPWPSRALLAVRRDEAGRAAGLVWHGARIRGLRCDRVAD